MQEAAKEPTHVNELVPGIADFKGTLDASGEAAGGIWIAGAKQLAPIRGRPVGAAHVRAGLGGVNTTIALDTGRQPFHQLDGEHYIKPIQRMLAGFKNFDPATEKKLACHPDFPAFACMHGHREGTSTYQQAVGDLTLIAFYYLLRVGEYTTKTRRKKRTRTRQFRAKDI
ncbi:hypothetical protein ACHAXR_009954 [Thalassiosira sp. AJA248-18]